MRTTENKTRVMVVDDEPFIRQIVCRILFDLGYRQTVEASDGEAGLKALRSASWPIGLVMLDIAMPRMDGLQFLRALRGPESGHKAVPVIMLTGHTELASLRECAAFGIHGFLAKPVSLANVEKQVNYALTSPPIDPAKIPGSLT